MSSTYLRLAAPLQSWAQARVTGNVVRTESLPTDSGLRGLVAASLGAPRGQWPDWLQDLTFTIRVERKGDFVDEYQTINPRDEDQRFQQRLYTLLTRKAWGKSAHFTPDGQYLTSIVNRTYLGDAEFLVELYSPDHAKELAESLRHPHFTPYLGRKAFSPTFPYYLGVGRTGLLSSLPTLDRRLSPGNDEPQEVAKQLVSPFLGRETVVVQRLSFEKWLQAIRQKCTLI